MRVAFFGSGDFGLPTLEGLAAAGQAAVVVTRPDQAAGRGRKAAATPVKTAAERLGLPVLQPEQPNTPEVAAALAELAPDLAVVVAYGHLIKKPLLEIPRRGFVNLHASLLPAYRGAAPVPRAILSGEATSGATVFSLDERFDCGGILGAVELAIDPEDTSGSYLRKLAPLGAGLALATASEFVAGRIEPRPQDESRASRAPKFRKEDGSLDWREPFASLNNKVRALQPWPLAFADLSTSRGAVRINVLRLEPSPLAGGVPPGTVIAADSASGLVVMAGDQPARIALFQPEGKRAMPDTDFLRGTRITP